ncbi:MAG TPA: hypothetical protein VJ521_01230 [Acidobacteriota bacterium]|nr:hypothetical protein [Acidobacteriota bacterium]
MKDAKIPSHQVDVVEIMRKIRQSAAGSRAELTLEEKVRREAKTEMMGLLQSAQVPDLIADEIRQNNQQEPYDPRTLYSSKRAGVGVIIGLIRTILKPITKLFINLDPMAHQVHRLTVLNNFYLKTIQDLVVKTASLRVEMHNLKKRSGHFRPRDEGSRYNNQRRYRDRYRRDDSRNPNPRNGVRTAPSEEPQT